MLFGMDDVDGNLPFSMLELRDIVRSLASSPRD